MLVDEPDDTIHWGAVSGEAAFLCAKEFGVARCRLCGMLRILCVSGSLAFTCYYIWVKNTCLRDTWRQDCDCLVSEDHFWLRTERPWSTKTTALIMWVHRKVSQHCCANHVSGHRLKAGQMLVKGQWGYVILIRGGFGEVNLVFYFSIAWAKTSVVSRVFYVSPHSLEGVPARTVPHFCCYQPPTCKAASCCKTLLFFIMWILPAKNG